MCAQWHMCTHTHIKAHIKEIDVKRERPYPHQPDYCRHHKLQDRRYKDHRTLLLRDMTLVPATQTKSERLKNDLAADRIEELDPRVKG